MKEQSSEHILEEYYLGKIIKKIHVLPALLKRLSQIDPSNTKYTLRYLTLKEGTILLYLDHVSTSNSCKNIHHMDILKTYQSEHSDAIPVDAGYLEFHPIDNKIIHLTKTGSSLTEYQLSYDKIVRQNTINLLTDSLLIGGFTCQDLPLVSAPEPIQPHYFD